MNPVSSRRQHLLGISGWLAFCLLVLVGCDGSDAGKLPFRNQPEKRLRFSIVVDSLANPLRNYQVTLLERLIRTRAGIDLTILDAGGDTSNQLMQLKKLTSDHVDCLVVFPQDKEACTPLLRSITAAGALVVVLGVEVTDDACTVSIHADDRNLGKIAGDFVLSALKRKAEEEGSAVVKGRVVQLTGTEDSIITQERSLGFKEALKTMPDVVLVHEAPANWNEKEAAERIKEALKLQKTFDVIYAQNDLMARGAGVAVREINVAAREAMLIVGTDGAAGKGGGIEMLMQGDMDATVYYPPLVDKAWQLINQVLDEPDFKAKIEKTYRIKPTIITLESAEEILRKGLPAPESESF